MAKLSLVILSIVLTTVWSKSLTIHENIIKTSDRKFPLILVPGLEASQLEAKLDKQTGPHWFCAKKSDWYHIWLNLKQMVPEVIDCFMDNFSMQYDNKTRSVMDAPGVQIRPVKPGMLEGVEYLGENHIGGVTSYFYNMIEKFVKLGYERDVNIRGAPYDFRRSPHDNKPYFESLKGIVEETYGNNGNIPCIMVCHSMGCMMSLHFLQSQPQSWKDKHVKGLISIGAPWGGSVKATEALVTGNSLKTFIYDDSYLRGMVRSFSSTYFLLPSKDGFSSKTPFMTLEGIDYHVDNYDHFFHLLDHEPYDREMWEDTKDAIAGLQHPGVDVTCLYGEGVETSEKLHFKVKDDFPHKPQVIKGTGDGTVNEASLSACLKWANHNQFNFDHQTFSGVSHVKSVKHDDIVEYVMNTVAKALIRS